MQLISAPANWNPCYNKRGDVVFVDDINGNLPFFDVVQIVPVGDALSQDYNVPADLIWFPLPSGYLDSDEVTGVGGFIQITGTENWDGIYRVAYIIGDPLSVFILDATITFDQVQGGVGEFRTHYNNMRLSAELTIEDTFTVKFRTDASANGQYIANINDYIKDYFKFQLSHPQQGSFNLFSTTIRSRLRWRSEYDRVFRNWDGTQFVYKKVRVVTPLSSSFVSTVVVNAALQYPTAFDTGALTAYVVGPSSPGTTKFATYRPRDTYVGENQDLFITTLRDQSDHTPLGVVRYFNSAGALITTVNFTAIEPVGYEWPHHNLWNIGSNLGAPPSAAYYTFHVSVGGVRRSEVITVRKKVKCGDIPVMWKNEFGAPEIINMFGVNEQTLGVDYQTAGTSDIINVANPGNYIKRSSESPYRIGLNTGLINTEHAKWLLSLGRTTEVFVKLGGQWHPIIITPQQLGPVSSNNRTHNLTFECEIPFTVAQIGNQTQ